MAQSGSQEICFSINGEEHRVSTYQQLSVYTSLNAYIRDVAGLKGTKVMCREGGCGCCSVTVTHASPESGKLDTYSVQSCLTPLYAVDGWHISTIEGIGGQKKGFHPIQERIAKFNGTQCGYCTPGMVMNMYGLLHQNPNITAQEVEDNFDGNMCRCTGYRSILDAMKSFSADGNIPGAKPIDIEDLNKNLCPKTGEPCKGSCGEAEVPRPLDFQINGIIWHRPTCLNGLGSLLKSYKSKKVRLLFGNTACGVYKRDGPFDVYIDLHNVKEIYSFQIDSNGVRIGGATTLTQLMGKLKGNQDQPGFHYFSAVYRHLKVVGNIMVRNAGCVAGNLMIKFEHPEFPSDVFTMFESLGTKVQIYDAFTSILTMYSLLEFMNLEMNGKVIVSLVIPKLDKNTIFKSYSVTPRWQNAHAYVNAAFKFTVETKTIKSLPSIVYGGINDKLIHAVKTEQFLANKTLSETVMKEALTVLKGELIPTIDEMSASPKYRQDLARNLLYKGLLEVFESSNQKIKTGRESLSHPISSGLQTFQELKSEFPLKASMPKQTATLQASGETIYVNDIPNFQHELFAAFVTTQVASGVLESVDATEALKMPGVVRFLTAKDIPEGGKNDWMGSSGLFYFRQEEIFATKQISYCGQTVGLILAKTASLAKAAARKVKVTYTDLQKPVTNLEESIALGKEFDYETKETVVGKPDDAWKNVEKTVEGEVRMGGQFHYYIETQVSLAVPSEDGIDLYCSTQFADMNQYVAAEVIGKPINYINVTVPLIGGGFGGKNFDSSLVSAATTLGAYLTGRPVRMSLDLSTNMHVCGKRPAVMAKYKAGFTSSGDVQVIDMDLYIDCGHRDSLKHVVGPMKIFRYIDMGYYVPNWKFRPHLMFTNKQTMTSARAPGGVPGALVIESIMEHVAKALNLHPIVVKEINLYEDGQIDLHGHQLSQCRMREVWRRIKDMAEVEGRLRQVEAFNGENLWKKRGLTMTACKYGVSYFGNGMPATVTIFARDGSVAISQGGVEMGQGLYTKVAQAVAHVLGVPIENIKVRPNQTIISPTSSVSAASIATDSAVYAAIEASTILKERMGPIREKYPDASWKELCQKCIVHKIDLSAKYMFAEGIGTPFFNYFVYSAAVAETEVDILTGESVIRRVDIMADHGESLNPAIDIGQIEGAFVMGLGSYMTEDIIFDSQTGRILNDGTWEYKPPTSKDIPIDWRIHLLPDAPNPYGVRSSKAVGESPISLSVGALFANKLAIQSARKDLFGADDFIPTVAPYSVERIQQSVGLKEDHFVF
ncbi:unnamed protein product [Lymnaea stagnalis]|uniref:Aldehyde oxidase n=1 Tax=Lymnaea stagnalis TaxID=6523 RepID=A0AAV2H6B2_LYMST